MKKTIGIILICTSPLIAGAVFGIISLLRWHWHWLIGLTAFTPWGSESAAFTVLLTFGAFFVALGVGISYITNQKE